METEIAGLLAFITKAEKLKTQVRHSWLSNSDRQESVAEHSWMLGLIAMSIFNSLDVKIDQLKVMKMVIIHDLAEAITGDIPTFEKSDRQTHKYENEKAAFEEITKELPSKVAKEFIELWLEMEQKITPEAKLAQCLDKVEVWIQHIIADIKTWDEGDYEVGIYHKDEYFDFNPYLRAFKDQVINQFWNKMEHEDKLHAVKPAELKRYRHTQ